MPPDDRRPIRVLPTLVANQIAAGEVVERPASIVKELLENALDARATRITLELESGGIELLRVSDDGVGIPPEELPLAIAPHATSKVAHADDLHRVATLGFRGEALASIASVSRLSIRSRTRDRDDAHQIDAAGDQVTGPFPTAGPPGTAVTVRTLFFNTPARRKFLRTIATEQDRCLDAARALIMAHPHVAFEVRCDGRVVLAAPAVESPRARVLHVLGKELDPELLEAHADHLDDTRGLSLFGLVGKPSIARASSKHQYLFINGRSIRDRTIQHALAEAYRGLIDPTRSPLAVLFLEMPPDAVDVNVHPAKAEVRFRDSGLVHGVVLSAVRRALHAADLTPLATNLTHSIASLQAPAVGTLPRDLPGPGLLEPAIASPAVDRAQALERFVSMLRQPPRPASPDASPPGSDATSPSLDAHAAPSNPGSIGPTDPAAGAALAPTLAPALGPAPAAASPAPPPVLQVHQAFLVTQDDQGVVIIDQHALHERVMFEYLIERVARSPLEQQALLVPAVVPATREQVEALPTYAPLLERVGILARPLTPSTIAIDAFPSFLFERDVDPVDFVQGLLDKFDLGLTPTQGASPTREDHRRLSEEALRDVLDMMACKAAVKAGDRLSDAELRELAALRRETDRAGNCPHGRPTSIRLTVADLYRLFGRS